MHLLRQMRPLLNHYLLPPEDSQIGQIIPNQGNSIYNSGGLTEMFGAYLQEKQEPAGQMGSYGNKRFTPLDDKMLLLGL